MRNSRILPLLGPAVVLYLVADLASSGRGLSWVGFAVAAVAVACSLAPLWMRARLDTGTRRAGSLGVAGGIGLLSAVEPTVMSIAVDVAAPIGAAVAGVLVVELALTVPDRPASFARMRSARTLFAVLAVAAVLAGVLAVMPPLEVGGRTVLLPVAWAGAPHLFALGCVLLALSVRLGRRRLGSGPEALASNAWALIGMLPAAASGAVAAVLAWTGLLDVGSAWIRGLAALSVLLTVGGHVALVDARRRLQAGEAGRRVLAAVVSLAVVAALVVMGRRIIPNEPFALGAFVAATLLVGVLVFRAVAPLVRFALAPWGGRLLAATDRAVDRLGDAASLEEVARAVLGPLRGAAASEETQPLLFTVGPSREARIDAAREPHVREHAMPEALAARLLERPGEVIVRAGLEGHVVRRPDLRALVEALVALDALCVVPLATRGELEGAIVVPKGRRRSPPSLEEIAALERLGRRVSGLVALVSAQARAQRRASEALAARDRLEERVEALEEELARLRADAHVLRAGRGASRMTQPPAAYSPAMRRLDKRLDDIAPLDAPVLLVAEGGSPIDQLARRIHAQSGRSDGPFVVADCASTRPEHTLAALCGADGDDPHPGWLRLASGGTLLLADVPALSLEAQRALAEAIATKAIRPVDGQGAHPVDVRIVATSRLSLDPLVRGGAFDVELGRWLAKLRVEVPPLRERREDIPSLTLLAIDRACRVLGREPVGVDKAVVETLATHDWPGNLRELQHVMDRAVASADGAQVRPEDLPPLAGTTTPTVESDPLAGTYAELEKRILTRAMDRADGNKSEAARLLGLKRTTFLDKLRRHDLDGKGKSASDAA